MASTSAVLIDTDQLVLRWAGDVEEWPIGITYLRVLGVVELRVDGTSRDWADHVRDRLAGAGDPIEIWHEEVERLADS